MQESRQVRRARERALDKQNRRAQRYNVAHCDPHDIRTLAEWRREDPIYAGYLDRAVDRNQPFFISQSGMRDLEPDFLIQWCMDNAEPSGIKMSAADVQFSKNLHEIYEDCDFNTPVHGDHHILVPVFDADQLFATGEDGVRKLVLENAEASYFNSYGIYSALSGVGKKLVDGNKIVNSLFLKINDPTLINPLTFCTTVAHEMTHLDDFMGMSRAQIKADYEQVGSTNKWIRQLKDRVAQQVKQLGQRVESRITAMLPQGAPVRPFNGQHRVAHLTESELAQLGGINEQNLKALHQQRAELQVATRWAQHLGETPNSMGKILQTIMEDVRGTRKIAKALYDQEMAQFSQPQRKYYQLLGMWDSQGGMTAREILQQEVIPQHQLFTFAWRAQQLRQQYEQYPWSQQDALQDLKTA